MPPAILIAIFILATPKLSRARPLQRGWLPPRRHYQLLSRRGGSIHSDQVMNLTYSTWSVPGERQYMEDEYFVSSEGTFAAVFDGHGGKAVSRYLRQNLYASYQAALPTFPSVNNLAGDDGNSELSKSTVSSALSSAFSKVDEEVQNIVHWSFQGSTSCVVAIHEDDSNGTRSIVSANVGDSRAILSRNGTAIDLTQDHKPNRKSERERIEALGGSVDWCGELDAIGEPVKGTGVYRISKFLTSLSCDHFVKKGISHFSSDGNLALSRAIGDRCERPFVSSTVDISHNIINEELDSFVVLATDGLFDVMTSQEVVSFIQEKMSNTNLDEHELLRNDMAKLVTQEALGRGSYDNITVIILWLNKK